MLSPGKARKRFQGKMGTRGSLGTRNALKVLRNYCHILMEVLQVPFARDKEGDTIYRELEPSPSNLREWELYLNA